ncbi:MAG: pilus assembly protein [Pirellulales bacterium]|nr:pilus assembly protein [Pirellulales bacterium]
MRSNSFSRPSARRGQALLEFGIISFLIFTIVIGTLGYGIQLWSAIMLQQAVDTGAVAASRVPLAPDVSFPQALENSEFRSLVYDPKFLVVTDQELAAANLTFGEFMSRTPTLNRMLAPLMVRDGDLHRYPGTIVNYTDFDGVTSEQTVLVPTVTGRGTRVVTWRFPVEEISYLGTSSSSEYSVFPTYDVAYIPAAEVTGGVPPTGLAGLRINYPHQSSIAPAFQYRDAAGNAIRPGEGQVAFNDLILADENLVVAPLPTTFATTVLPSGFTAHRAGFSLAVSGADQSLGPFSGQYGLGRFVVGNLQVRPFRQVMSFQAVRLRELFQ